MTRHLIANNWRELTAWLVILVLGWATVTLLACVAP